MKGKLKKILLTALSICLLAGGVMQVSAATLKDVFDEKYYADSYPDLKAVYGYDREALYKHFMTYGANEGRNMNELIDIAKYRKMYPDLEKAFGNNWNAYLNHFLKYGAAEGRETGTSFNALDYVNRYGDLKKAFGTNILAIYKHYRTSGKLENREARSERIVIAEKQAEAAAAAAAAARANGPWTERLDNAEKGYYVIVNHDSYDRVVKETYYTYQSNARVEIHEYKYDSAGEIAQKMFYFYDESTGKLTGETECSGDAVIKDTRYNYQDGSLQLKEEYRYDSAGKTVGRTEYRYEGGSVAQTVKYVCNDAGRPVQGTFYDASDRKTSEVTYDPAYDGDQGRVLTEIQFNPATGEKTAEISMSYREDGTSKWTIKENGKTMYQYYDAQGNPASSVTDGDLWS